ncbi:hypothetical protein HDU98_008130, partial [Podochytrium sp. JEL0797]
SNETERDPILDTEDYFTTYWKHLFWKEVGKLNFSRLPTSYTTALLRLTGFNRRSLGALGVATSGASVLLVRWRTKQFAENRLHIEQALLSLLHSKDWVRNDCDLNLLLVWSCAAGSIDTVQYLSTHHWAETAATHSLALITSAGCGHLAILEYLVQDLHLDPSASNNAALEWAAKSGHLQTLNFLLQDPRVNPADAFSMPLVWACKYGHVRIVERLLSDGRSDPSAQNNSALVSAARAGYTEIVTLLLQDARVNANAQDGNGLLSSSCLGHAGTLEVLLQAGGDPSLVQFKPFLIALKAGKAEIVEVYMRNATSWMQKLWMRTRVLVQAVWGANQKYKLVDWMSMLFA